MLWDLSVAWTLQGGTMALITFTWWKGSRPAGKNGLWIRPISLKFYTWLLAKPQCSFSPSLERCQKSRVNNKTDAWNSGQKFWKTLFPIVLKHISVNLCWFWLGYGELIMCAIFCKVPSPIHLKKQIQKMHKLKRWKMILSALRKHDHLHTFIFTHPVCYSSDLLICICKTNLFGSPFIAHYYHLCSKYGTIDTTT